MRVPAAPKMQIFRIDEIQILIVLPRDHGELAVNFSREQRHTLVSPGGTAAVVSGGSIDEIVCFQQF